MADVVDNPPCAEHVWVAAAVSLPGDEPHVDVRCAHCNVAQADVPAPDGIDPAPAT